MGNMDHHVNAYVISGTSIWGIKKVGTMGVVIRYTRDTLYIFWLLGRDTIYYHPSLRLNQTPPPQQLTQPFRFRQKYKTFTPLFSCCNTTIKPKTLRIKIVQKYV